MHAHRVWCCLYRRAYLIAKDGQIKLTAEQINMHTYTQASTDVYLFPHTLISSHLAQILMPEAREYGLQWVGSRRWHFGSCWHYTETERAWQGPVSTNYIIRLLNVKQLIPIRSQTPHRSASPSIRWLQRYTYASLMAQTWSGESREYNSTDFTLLMQPQTKIRDWQH